MLLSYQSSYLLERNIIQICLMGSVGEEQCLQMVETFVADSGSIGFFDGGVNPIHADVA